MNKKDCQIPIIVGITGHIDIFKKDEADLRKAVRNILNTLNKEYPNSPKVLLSSLAEGADRIAADEALNCGFSLVAPLPMPVEEYEKDFITEESKKEFHSLLSRADTYFTAPGNAGSKPGCYRSSSIYTAKYSNILIALWDGNLTHKSGGTCDTVRMKLEGLPNEETGKSILDMPENGVVYHILTPRKQNPTPPGIPFSLKKLYSGNQESNSVIEAESCDILKKIDLYNKDAASFQTNLSIECEQSRKYMIEDEYSEHLTPGQNRILDSFLMADRLSVYFRDKRISLLRLFVFMGLVIAVLYTLYDELESNIMLPFYLAAFISAYALYFHTMKKDYQNKSIDYRALAEGLRVQFYWMLCGTGSNAHDHYPYSQKQELDWIRYSISNISHSSNPEIICSGSAWAFDATYNNWIKGQCDYYKDAAAGKSRLMDRQNCIINILFISSIVLVIAVTILEFGFMDLMGRIIPAYPALQRLLLTHVNSASALVNTGSTVYLELNVRGIFKVLFALTAAMIAFLSNYNSKLALSEHIKSYIKMHRLFELAGERFRQAQGTNNSGLVKEIVFQLGKEALSEDGSWVILNRERPIEVPK